MPKTIQVSRCSTDTRGRFKTFYGLVKICGDVSSTEGAMVCKATCLAHQILETRGISFCFPFF